MVWYSRGSFCTPRKKKNPEITHTHKDQKQVSVTFCKKGDWDWAWDHGKLEPPLAWFNNMSGKFFYKNQE